MDSSSKKAAFMSVTGEGPERYMGKKLRTVGGVDDEGGAVQVRVEGDKL